MKEYLVTYYCRDNKLLRLGKVMEEDIIDALAYAEKCYGEIASIRENEDKSKLEKVNTAESRDLSVGVS
ncbi:MAG: hypothetical protein SCK28_05845 [Bacillota bacterium]|nr:hypothetical protein [Bacillota bacterium]